MSKKLTIDLINADDDGFFVKDHPKFGVPTKGKRIFFRADYNVPIKNGVIKDTIRIDSTIPSLKMLIALKPDVIILCSHLGRPAGNATKESLKPIVPVLEKHLNTQIKFFDYSWYNDSLKDELKKLPKGSIVLLENVRFYLEEEGKGETNGQATKAKKEDIAKFRQFLASLCDLFVNDAFGCCHRDHSSISGVNVPLRAAGLLVKKELNYFDKAVSNPSRPYLAILGGAKVADKIQVIKSLLGKVDEMIIAGGMCFTFLKVINKMEIGKSIYDNEGAKIVQELVQLADEKKVKLHLPVDFICGSDFNDEAKVKEADVKGGIDNDYMGMDIGEQSIKLFGEVIGRAKTIVFNGPPGVFEFKKFSNGTQALLKDIAAATDKGSITIVGGGDSAAAASQFGYDNKVSHVSTGGGASLELLEGKELPGVTFISEL